MDILATSKQERQSRRLEADPGNFDPVTAFRIAQHLADPDDLDVGSHTGAKPAPLAVSSFRRSKGRIQVLAAFAPLVGPLGPLPPSYNELLQREQRNRSKALASFFNLFSARFAELFVGATEKYRLARGLRWTRVKEKNPFYRTLFALTGFGTSALTERAGVDEEVLLRFSGFFADRTRNAQNLTAMLCEYTGLPVVIEQFRRRWVPLPEHEQSKMAGTADLRLGVNVTAGSAVEDYSGGFRIVLGPLGYHDYLTLTPGSTRLMEIVSLSRLYVGSALEFDVQVILKKEDVPFCQLGATEVKARLGWNSWARSEPAAQDSGEAIIPERQALAVTE
ncbi:type VI secretion system baseplate subunit TssG [Oryzifoliimicrobium ureilyticus]|uniref:type VI secretion system baseplate subunit TssG n=1 Tax=Oryzifoliimicrobium ureilyticus TaxID=3113724 RepID=UPI0030762D51